MRPASKARVDARSCCAPTMALKQCAPLTMECNRRIHGRGAHHATCGIILVNSCNTLCSHCALFAPSHSTLANLADSLAYFDTAGELLLGPCVQKAGTPLHEDTILRGAWLWRPRLLVQNARHAFNRPKMTRKAQRGAEVRFASSMILWATPNLQGE